MIYIGDLTDREQQALAAFKKKPRLQFNDLPPNIGLTTLADLVSKGFIEVANPRVGRFSMHARWRLKTNISLSV
jgi:hypothetical protein